MEQEPKNANHNMKTALYGGLSVTIGLTLYAAFQYDASIRELTLRNMPIDQAGQLLGGHMKDFVFVPMVAAGIAFLTHALTENPVNIKTGAVLGLGAGLTIEALKIPHLIPGVADMGDIMAYTAGFAVALIPAALMHFASRNKRG